jgi:ferric-dicitrate binding protein FerR (iron transport regulator)
MSTPIPDDLMARVLAGEASAEELARVEAWAAESPVHARELGRLRAAFEPRGTVGSWDVDRAWATVESQVQAGDSEVEVIPIPAAPRWSTTLLRMAAAVLVVVGAVFAWRELRSPGAPTTYATAAAERLEVPLSDGSTVVLAPRSTLTVPANYAADREIALEGEGWFDVVHDDSNPFRVNVAGFEVRDVGTVFTVEARRAVTIVVTVVEGEVLVHHRSGELADASLTPGQVGRFTGPAFGRDGRTAVTDNQPVDELTSWSAGSLELVDATVAEVLARLAEWYGISFSVADSAAANRTITATLPLDSIDEATGVLALLLEVEAVRDSTGVIFR